MLSATRHVNRIKIKGMVRAKGGIHSQQWYTDGKVQGLRKKCRTQSLWNLHLAGAMAAKVCCVLGRKGLRAYLSTSLMCLPCIAKKTSLPLVRRLAPCHGNQGSEWIAPTPHARDADSERCSGPKICKRSSSKASKLSFASFRRRYGRP